MPHTLIPHLRRPPSIATLARVTTIAALVALPIAATAQLGAGVARATKLEPTSMSALAISEFNSAMNDLSNAQVARGTEHLRRALAADPTLGVARAFYGFNAVGLTRTQRELELDRAVTDALRGSTPELLIATAMRARFRGDLVQTQSLMRSAAQILPNDPTIAYQVAWLNGQVPGNRYTDAIAPMRTLTTRFPEFAPPHNLLAYSLFRSGERAAALEMVQLYVAKAPNEPNPHDSYGELLQWSGRLTDAAQQPFAQLARRVLPIPVERGRK